MQIVSIVKVLERFYIVCLGVLMAQCSVSADEVIPIMMDDITIMVTTKYQPITVVHNGTTYSTIKSPYTGRVWLDRNLGASRVCTNFDDTACYGDYYQWGRNYDGHQYSQSSTTNTQATNINNAGTDFIAIDDTMEFDWAETVDYGGASRSLNWAKTDGSSVCPAGFRVPTMEEFKMETLDKGVTNSYTAFINFLKIPSAGYREGHTGTLYYQGTWGNIWTGSIYAFGASAFYFGKNSAHTDLEFRSFGLSVRCIKD